MAKRLLVFDGEDDFSGVWRLLHVAGAAGLDVDSPAVPAAARFENRRDAFVHEELR